ncbi:phage tail protein [Paenibacillus maysiensis]|uniref:phage tail protein n=1 Tax=Paenibacillus maysiensis TaxID=1155954 RepID=UPI00046F9651|nr:phage tail protein [Paenibacillus maysiensis]
MEKMYPPVVNSPKTELTELITDKQTEITVANASVLLQGEGIAVLGNGDAAETITYTSVEDNVLKGCLRGFEGVARAWPVGTRVARNFTAADFRAAQENITEIDGKVTSLSATVAEKTQDASLTKKGVTQLSKAVDGTRDTVAATESAVKAAYDLVKTANNAAANAQSTANTAKATADAALPKSGGQINGTFSVRHPSQLSQTAGSTQDIAYFGAPSSNETGLFIRQVRFANGQNWDTSATDIRRRTDATDQAVLRFQGDDIYFQNADASWTSLRSLKANNFSGNGSPEGAITAPVGSLYRRWDGGPSSTLYVKESGAGNIGWRAV